MRQCVFITERSLKVRVRYDVNEFCTPVSVHICEFCGVEFTVTPAVKPENDDDWRGCMAPECPSYDPERDADKLFDEGKVKFFPKDRLN